MGQSSFGFGLGADPAVKKKVKSHEPLLIPNEYAQEKSGDLERADQLAVQLDEHQRKEMRIKRFKMQQLNETIKQQGQFAGGSQSQGPASSKNSNSIVAREINLLGYNKSSADIQNEMQKKFKYVQEIDQYRCQ